MPIKKVSKKEKKQKYFERFLQTAEQYPKCFIVSADNIGSNHMQKIRSALRGKATLLFGKNTLIRKAIRMNLTKLPRLEPLLDCVKGNVGFVFMKEEQDMAEVKQVIFELKVGAPAKVGAIAPCDVSVPKGPTGLEPTKTSFLQALNIPTKINRGQIEITAEIQLITEGDKVGGSEATLLQMLNIRPFAYGLKLRKVFDKGSVYDPQVLDLSDADIIKKFQSGLSRLTSVSLAINYPTIAALPHSIVNAYKNILSICFATSYSFDRVEELKDMAENPEKYASLAPAATEAAPAEEKKEEKEEEAAPEEESQSESGDMDDLFGDDF